MRVGLWIPRTKLDKMDFGACEAEAVRRGVELVHVDHTNCFSAPPLFALIHKVTYDLVKVDHDEEARARFNAFKDFVNQRQGMRVLDPLAAIETIMRRSDMYTLIASLSVQTLVPAPHVKVRPALFLLVCFCC